MPPLEAKHHTSNTETLLTDQGGSSKAPPKAPHWRKQAPCRQRLLQQTTFKQAELFNAQLMGEKTSKKPNKIQLHQPSSAKLPPPKKKEKKKKTTIITPNLKPEFSEAKTWISGRTGKANQTSSTMPPHGYPPTAALLCLHSQGVCCALPHFLVRGQTQQILKVK